MQNMIRIPAPFSAAVQVLRLDGACTSPLSQAKHRSEAATKRLECSKAIPKCFVRNMQTKISNNLAETEDRVQQTIFATKKTAACIYTALRFAALLQRMRRNIFGQQHGENYEARRYNNEFFVPPYQVSLRLIWVLIDSRNVVLFVAGGVQQENGDRQSG